MNIFVAKLSYDTEESTVLGLFKNFGTVESVKIIKDKFDGRSKGYGFVEMPNDDEANAAINELNESEVDGRTIVVKESQPRESNRGGGNRRYDRNDRGGGGGWNR